MEESTGNLLRDLYTDISNPDAFSHPLKIYKQARELVPSLTLKQTREALSALDSYSRFKPINARRRARQSMVTRADDADERWQLDLMNVSSFGPQRNQGFSHLLLLIDVFTRYLIIVPLYDKSSTEVTKGTELIFMTTGRIPRTISTDSGTEFTGKPFRSLCRKYNIKLFFTVPNITHASIVERVIRTIRNRIGKYLMQNHTRNFIDGLGAIVSGYNNTLHTSLGMSPSQAYSSDANRQLALFHWKSRQKRVRRAEAPSATSLLRLPIVRRRFSKAHEPSFSSQVFRMADIFNNDRNSLVFRIAQPNASSRESVSSKSFFYPFESSFVSE